MPRQQVLEQRRTQTAPGRIIFRRPGRDDAIALGAIGVEAKSALTELRRLDADPQKLVRDAAKQARARISG